MNIQNDIITFDESDFDALSEDAKSALKADRPEFVENFSEFLTQAVRNSVNTFAAARGINPGAADLIVRLGKVHPDKHAEIAAALDAAALPRNIISPIPADREVEPAFVPDAEVVKE